jgi:hypothetical protein
MAVNLPELSLTEIGVQRPAHLVIGRPGRNADSGFLAASGVVVTLGYQTRMVAPGLRLTVPDWIVPADAQGIDSMASALSGGGITIIVDEGPFSDPATRYADQPSYEISAKTINGHPMRIVSFEDNAGVRYVMARLEVEDNRGTPKVVTIVIQVEPDADLVVAQNVLESTSFQP